MSVAIGGQGVGGMGKGGQKVQTSSYKISSRDVISTIVTIVDNSELYIWKF